MFVSWKRKSTVTKKVIVCFYKFWCWKLSKAAAFVIYSSSMMVFFEIHLRFKTHLLKKLRVSCNEIKRKHTWHVFIKLSFTTLLTTAIPSIIIQESSCFFTKFVGKVESDNSSGRWISFDLSLDSNGCHSTENNDLGTTQNS